MKKGYWVIAYRSVGDEAAMKQYVPLAVAALGKFGARTLVSPASTAITVEEAGLKLKTSPPIAILSARHQPISESHSQQPNPLPNSPKPNENSSLISRSIPALITSPNWSRSWR